MIVTAIVLGVIALSAELAILAGMVCDGERWNTWPLNVLLWTLIALSIPSLLVVATIVLLVPLQRYRLTEKGRGAIRQDVKAHFHRPELDVSPGTAPETAQETNRETNRETSPETSLKTSSEKFLNRLSKGARQIVALIKADDRITTQSMADRIKVSKRMVMNYVKELTSVGLRHEGPTKKGRWVFATAKKGGVK